MSTMKRAFVPTVALLAALASPIFCAAEEYQLVFDRSHEVGAQYTITGEAYITEEMHQQVNGELTEENESSSELNLSGVVEVLAVNENGGVSQAALAVGEYDIEINSEGVELQADRRIMAVVEDDEVSYSYENGAAITGDLAELLDMFLDGLVDEDGDGGDTDKMMNAQEPRSPGDRWEMNHAQMIEDAGEGGELGMEEEDMESEVHFVEVNDNNDFGIPMAVIEMGMRVVDFTFPTDEFPEWLVVDGAVIEMEGGGMLPLDVNSSVGSNHVEMEMAFQAAGTVPGQDVEVKVEFEMQRGSSITLGEVGGD